MIPINNELIRLLDTLSREELAWLSGYCWAKGLSLNDLSASQSPIGQLNSIPQTSAEKAPIKTEIDIPVLVLFASQTGNAKGVATRIHQALLDGQIPSELMSLSDYAIKSLTKVQRLLFITSTQGEGEPPEDALPFYRWLKGKKAPQLDKLSYAVLGLGDRSYPEFCQAAKDADALFETLGGTRLLSLQTCDVAYEADVSLWQDQIIAVLQKNTLNALTVFDASLETPSPISTTAAVLADKDHPVEAHISTQQKITARSANKNIQHIEIDTDNTSISYLPGDSLGVWARNSPETVACLLDILGLRPEETVNVLSQDMSLEVALTQHFDLVKNSCVLMTAYAEHIQNPELNQYLESIKDDKAQNTPPLIEFLATFPHPIAAQELCHILYPMTPRLYSIASSQSVFEDEAHLCVSLEHYQHKDKTLYGTASGYLTHGLEEGDALKIFIQENPHFRLPKEAGVPIMMIGAGTGIAPFRAFMQQREYDQDTGKNWLIFGNQRFIDDFLYQTEWAQYRKKGLLNRMDVAWSRQGPEKVYVQDKIKAAASEVWAWLNAGAHLYVCGNAQKMAKDVEQALLHVIITEGKYTEDDAWDYLDELRTAHRYQRDIY